MESADEFALALTTAGSDDEASRIAHALVERGLAACVNIVPAIRSIYRWQGRICDDSERLLLIKTRAALFARVRETIRELHSYELPEAILVPITDGDREYLDWLTDSTG